MTRINELKGLMTRIERINDARIERINDEDKG